MKLSFVTATLLSTLALAGCVNGPDGDVDSASEAVVVTAHDTRGLTGAQRLEEDLAPGTVITFDASLGPIDFARVDLVTPASTVVPMDSIVDSMARSEGTSVDTLSHTTFSISADALVGHGANASGASEASPQLAPTCTFFVYYQTSDGVWHRVAFPC